MSFSLPTGELCFDCNLPLWQVFAEAFQSQRGYSPSPNMWTEAEVVQWLDLEFQGLSPVDVCYPDAML